MSRHTTGAQSTRPFTLQLECDVELVREPGPATAARAWNRFTMEQVSSDISTRDNVDGSGTGTAGSVTVARPPTTSAAKSFSALSSSQSDTPPGVKDDCPNGWLGGVSQTQPPPARPLQARSWLTDPTSTNC